MTPLSLRIVGFLVALAFATSARAQDAACPAAAEATLRAFLAQTSATTTASQGELRELVCATITTAHGEEWVAVANFVDAPPESEERGEEGYTLVLAGLDRAGRRVNRHAVVRTSEDASTLFRGNNFRLDTQFQDIAPGGGVIGVAATTSAAGPSAPDNQWGDEFALYVPEGMGFRRVLGVARFRQESIEGCVSVQCRGARWIETTASLSPGETDGSGWRRIALRLDATEQAVKPARAQSKPSTTTLALVHRDGVYRTESGDPPPGSDYFGLVAW